MLSFRVGHGYDLHRLEPVMPDGPGRPFVLGGVHIEHERGPVGHSDGDTLLHALTDALLGSIGAPDIGQLFPDTEPEHEAADSAGFVRKAMARLTDAGYVLGNVDITVVCERPKLGPVKAEIIEHLARLLECDRDRINIKGKTHERVDAVGEGRAIEVHCVALVVANDSNRPE